MDPTQISCRVFSLLCFFFQAGFSCLRFESIPCELSLSSVLVYLPLYLNVIEVVVSRIVISAVLGRNSQNKPNGVSD